MNLIPNDWNHSLRKTPLKTFYYNNKGTKKVKYFQKLSNKETYFTVQSNSTKYNKPIKLISWLNFLEGYHILSPDI